MEKRAKMSERPEEEESTTPSSFSLQLPPPPPVGSSPTPPLPLEKGQENKGIMEARARLHMHQIPT